MDQDILRAILAGLGGMLGWGLADFFAKKTIDEIGDVTTLFWGQLIGILPLSVLLLSSSSPPDLSNWDPIGVMLLGIFSGLSYLPVYIAFGKGKISLISPIFASYSAVVALISWIIFAELLTGLQQLAILIVFFGILLASADLQDLRNTFKNRSKQKIQGLREILVAVVGYSAWLIALDRFLSGRDWVPFLLGIRIFSALTLFAYIQATKAPLKVTKRSVWKFLVLIGLFDVGAFGAVSYGFSQTSHTAIVTVLSATFSIPTILLGRAFLGEKSTRQQALATAIILIGIVIVTLSGGA